MSTPDDELQKIFRENRKEFLDNKETPHFPPLVTQKTMVSTPSGSVEVDIKHPIETFPKCKPGENIKESPIENNGERVIGSQRDISLEKKVWQQKIQPINDRCLNGEFHYDPCPGVAELTDKSIALVHKMIFRLFNKLIYFPTQLTQMAPPIDQDRQAKELVLAFDDIVLKKLRAGLGTPNKNELFFDFLQDVYDCNLLPAFLTYLGHFCTTFTNSPEQGLKENIRLNEKETPFSQEKPENQMKHGSIAQSDIKTDSQEIALILKCAKIGDKYAEETLKKTGDLPTIPEIDEHVETNLKQSDESLGKTKASVLPVLQARRVRDKMNPQNIRAVGQKK